MKVVKMIVGIFIMTSPITALLLSPLWNILFQIDLIKVSLDKSTDLFGEWTPTMFVLIILAIIILTSFIGWVFISSPEVKEKKSIVRYLPRD